MPRYFFHLFNDETTMDEEGKELPNDAAAFQHAADCARVMAAESVRNGHLIIDHRIEITRADGRKRRTVYFRDRGLAVTNNGPAEGKLYRAVRLHANRPGASHGRNIAQLAGHRRSA